MRIAVTRRVSPSIGRCELTHLERQPVDLARAERQHEAYEACLVELGCRLHSLDAEADLPDSVFVEDLAVVLDEAAIVTRPGAASRRDEAPAIAATLADYRDAILPLTAPAVLDGGDVLRVDRTLYVGSSTRTNEEGVRQLAALAGPLGYTVTRVEVGGCLHLKSAVTCVGPRTILVQADWIDIRPLADLRRIEVDPAEPLAANALRVGELVVCAAAYPRTRERLEQHGLRTVALDADELAKAEGGLTCCSLIFDQSASSSFTAVP